MMEGCQGFIGPFPLPFLISSTERTGCKYTGALVKPAKNKTKTFWDVPAAFFKEQAAGNDCGIKTTVSKPGCVQNFFTG
jgi:hypothetical protein